MKLVKQKQFKIWLQTRNLSRLSHISSQTKLPCMVDISEKIPTTRYSKAKATIELSKEVFHKLEEHEGDILSKKGPVFAVAVCAGTTAVKNTSNLITFCHQISISAIDFEIEKKNSSIEITCVVKTNSSTGVEMEALTGVTVASLNVYDMLKSLSFDTRIKDVHLVEKSGGKSDYFTSEGSE